MTNLPSLGAVSILRRIRRLFANDEAAEAWFKENDPEGVAFEYPVIGTDEE
jgi:hypothetical protein